MSPQYEDVIINVQLSYDVVSFGPPLSESSGDMDDASPNCGLSKLTGSMKRTFLDADCFSLLDVTIGAAEKVLTSQLTNFSSNFVFRTRLTSATNTSIVWSAS